MKKNILHAKLSIRTVKKYIENKIAIMYLIICIQVPTLIDSDDRHSFDVE